MKKKILLVTVCFMFLFVGCSKDDSPTITEPVNNFKNTKWEYTGNVNRIILVDFTNDTECKWTMAQTTIPPTYSYYDYTFTVNTATILYKGTKTVADVCQLNGNTITFSGSGIVFTSVN